MQQAIKRGGRTDFWQLSAKPRLLPRETRDYVPMILAAIVIARNPAQYGFVFEKEDSRPFETVSLARPVDLTPHRRMDRHDGRRHSGAQPGIAAEDDADRRQRNTR